MTTSDELITDEVVSTAKRLEELTVDDVSDDTDPLDPLDVKAEVNARGDITEIILVVTTGGPHIEVRLPSDTVEGWWSSGNHATHFRNDELSDYLWDYYYNLFDDVVLA